jgi:hypothetical protein
VNRSRKHCGITVVQLDVIAGLGIGMEANGFEHHKSDCFGFGLANLAGRFPAAIVAVQHLVCDLVRKRRNSSPELNPAEAKSDCRKRLSLRVQSTHHNEGRFQVREQSSSPYRAVARRRPSPLRTRVALVLRFAKRRTRNGAEADKLLNHLCAAVRVLLVSNLLLCENRSKNGGESASLR